MGKSTLQMQFTLTGFTQETGSRVFAYEGVGEDRVRIRYTVRADLALSRKYGIRLQELPLMCLGILERMNSPEELAGADPSTSQKSVTFTEEAMIRYADEIVAAREAAALKRSSTRKQPVKEAAAAAAAGSGEFNPYTDTAAAPVKPYGQNW
jgi:hypothetical protein